MNHFERLQEKILTPEGLQSAILRWRLLGDKIVFTNGCFDLLHRGHVDYLAHAADFGNRLIIGLNTDASVSRLKGPHRPINDQDARAVVLAGLSFVSGICLFDEPTPYELIRLLQPDVLVKGADYKIEDIAGYDIVQARGGQVITVPLVANYSTSTIEAKILEAAGKP
jgi:rfaE bifunctional protein nucleotidyltransferase chain/domain